MVMAVDDVADGLVRDLANLREVLLAPGGTPVAHGIGRDHAVAGDDEHRLAVLVAECVDTLGAVHFLCFDLRGLGGGGRSLALRHGLRGQYGAGKDRHRDAVHKPSSRAKTTLLYTSSWQFYLSGRPSRSIKALQRGTTNDKHEAGIVGDRGGPGNRGADRRGGGSEAGRRADVGVGGRAARRGAQ